uniref:Uncharacterized protein n=1 Tax=Myoviridae sp. ctCo31 TaxID=2825053 RepID=A0A8S5UMD3_9CAUD|nr:MAG TPA: hypothetical protein [Myoviridae sp. ctCo31]
MFIYSWNRRNIRKINRKRSLRSWCIVTGKSKI